MLRSRRLIVASALVFAACRDHNATEPSIGRRDTVIASVADLSQSCAACTFGPRVFARAAPEVRTERATFEGDPRADYYLRIDGASSNAAADVWVNGVRVLNGSQDRVRVRQPVRLRPENVIEVRIRSAVGTALTIAIEGGTEIVGTAGALVTAPGSGATLLVPAGALARGTLRVALNDTTGVPPQHATVGISAAKLVLGVEDSSFVAGAGDLILTLPLARPVPTGFRGVFHARVNDVPEPLWAVAQELNGALQLAFPASSLAQIVAVTGSAEAVLTITSELLTAPSVAPTSHNSLRHPTTRSRGTAGTRTCTHNGADHYVTVQPLLPYLVHCDEVPLLSRMQAPSQPSSVAIVLVHGWNPNAEGPVDLYRAQGLHCDSSSSSNAVAFTCDSLSGEEASWPVEEYFAYTHPKQTPPVFGQGLLPTLRNAFPSTAIYGFSYASYSAVRDNGQALARLLSAEARLSGITKFIIVAHSMGGLVARVAADEFANNPALGPNAIQHIVTLGTPHEGSPLATQTWAGLGLKGLLTVGGQDLRPTGSGGPLWPSLPTGTELVSYYGSLSWTQTNCQKVIYMICAYAQFPIVGHDINQVWSGAALCRLSNVCISDGVVPIISGSWPSGATRTRSYAYDHTQLHAGSLPSPMSDPLHTDLITDISAWFAASARPNPPTNFTARVRGSYFVSLSWQDNSPDEDGFELEVATDSAGPYTPLASPAANITSYEAYLPPGTLSYLRVSAVRQGVRSSPATTFAQTLVSLPGLNSCPSAAFASGNLLLFGWCRNGYFGSETYALDVANNRWLSRAPFGPLVGIGAYAVVGSPGVLGGHVYLVGGTGYGIPRSDVKVYDVARDVFASGRDLPTPAAATVGGTINGLLYVYLPGIHLFYRYDPAADSWTVLPSPPTARLSAAGGAVGGKFVLVGGEDPLGAGVLDVLEIFDPSSNAWSQGPPMPTPRTGPGAVVSGSKLFVAGGYRNCPQHCSYEKVVESYDFTANSWSRLPDLVEGRRQPAVATDGSALYVLGGVGAGGVERDDIELVELSAPTRSARTVPTRANVQHRRGPLGVGRPWIAR